VERPPAGALGWRQFVLDVVDQLEVQLQQAAHEAGHKQQVLASVGEILGARLELVDAHDQIGDVLAQRADSGPGRALADQVGNQQAQQGLALQGQEPHRRLRPRGERVEALGVEVAECGAAPVRPTRPRIS
jgi:hypothetical protein